MIKDGILLNLFGKSVNFTLYSSKVIEQNCNNIFTCSGVVLILSQGLNGLSYYSIAEIKCLSLVNIIDGLCSI